MKKIIISIVTISVFIFTSCFTDTDTATVKINLGNIPVAEVEKKSIIDRFLMFFAKEAVAQPFGVTVVHLGAFDANNELLASQRISSNNYPENNIIEFDVPAGIRRKIVVLGEQEIGEDENSNPIYGAGYYGVNKEEINLNAGEVVPVEIKMEELEERNESNHNTFPTLNLVDSWVTGNSGVPAKWDHIPGASKYNIYKYNWTNSEYELLSSSAINSYSEGGTFSLRIYFDFANIESNYLSFKVC